MSTKQSTCAFCERESHLTFHHLIPKSIHHRRKIKEKWTVNELHSGILLCRSCHNAIHKFISHAEIVEEYHTVEKLLEHQMLREFVEWSKKQHRQKKIHAPKK